MTVFYTRRARTLPRSADLPFTIRVQRNELAWKVIAECMAVMCLALLAAGWAVTR